MVSMKWTGSQRWSCRTSVQCSQEDSCKHASNVPCHFSVTVITLDGIGVIHVDSLHRPLLLQLVRRLVGRVPYVFDILDILFLVRIVCGRSVCSHDGQGMLDSDSEDSTSAKRALG